MHDNKSILFTIADVLTKIGTEKCLLKAAELMQDHSSNNVLHLRDLDLTEKEVISITEKFVAKKNSKLTIKSLSFSYNKLLGDNAIIAILKNLPISVTELGLVNCGIGDIGGLAILHFLKQSPHLKMLCMEGNKFSEKLRMELNEFNIRNSLINIYF